MQKIALARFSLLYDGVKLDQSTEIFARNSFNTLSAICDVTQ